MNALCNIPYDRHRWVVKTLAAMRTGLPAGDIGDMFNAGLVLITLGLASLDDTEAGRVYNLTDAGRRELARIEAGEAALARFVEDGDFCAIREYGAAGVLALCDALDGGAARDIELRAARLLLRRYAEDDADLWEPQTAHAPAWTVDTREQAPLTPHAWTGQWRPCPVHRDGLPAGDYVLYDCTDRNGKAHDVLLVERKSAADLLGSLTAGLDRLRSELLKAAQQYPRIVILVEAMPYDFWELVAARTPDGKFDGRVRQLQGAILSLHLDYGAAVAWAGSREGSERWLGWMGQRITRMLTDEKKRKELFSKGIDKVAPWMVRGEDE